MLGPLNRTGYVLRCREGCQKPFAIYTTKLKGQFRCPRCGHRPRADLRGGGSAAVLKGPFEWRSEAKQAAIVLMLEEAGLQ